MNVDDPLECDVCATEAGKIVRFNLIKNITLPDGRPTSRGAGRIYLCARCWNQLRRRPMARRRAA